MLLLFWSRSQIEIAFVTMKQLCIPNLCLKMILNDFWIENNYCRPFDRAYRRPGDRRSVASWERVARCARCVPREMRCHVRVRGEPEQWAAWKTAESFRVCCGTVSTTDGRDDVGEIRQSDHGFLAGRPSAPGGIRPGGCQERLDGGTLNGSPT